MFFELAVKNKGNLWSHESFMSNFNTFKDRLQILLISSLNKPWWSNEKLDDMICFPFSKIIITLNNKTRKML